VDVGPSAHGAQGPTGRVHHEAPFHPLLLRSVGLGPTKSPPIRALLSMVSAACHGQSTPPNSWQAWTSTAQMRSKRPC
jgi:hypothetical protein